MYASELSFVGVLLYFKQYPCELKCVLKDLFVWSGLAPGSLPGRELWKNSAYFLL